MQLLLKSKLIYRHMFHRNFTPFHHYFSLQYLLCKPIVTSQIYLYYFFQLLLPFPRLIPLLTRKQLSSYLSCIYTVCKPISSLLAHNSSRNYRKQTMHTVSPRYEIITRSVFRNHLQQTSSTLTPLTDVHDKRYDLIESISNMVSFIP